jgi:hypothetical protein
MARAFYNEGVPMHEVGRYNLPLDIKINIVEDLPTDSVLYSAETFVDGELYRAEHRVSKLQFMGRADVRSREKLSNEAAYKVREALMAAVQQGEPWQPNAKFNADGSIIIDENGKELASFMMEQEPDGRFKFQEINLLDRRVKEITSLVSL